VDCAPEGFSATTRAWSGRGRLVRSLPNSKCWPAPCHRGNSSSFEVDPVRYADALGEEGLTAYRDAVAAIDDAGSWAVRYAHERLAVLDRDIEKIVETVGGDLSIPYHFFRVAEAMAELGRDDLVLTSTLGRLSATRPGGAQDP
jgi:hypothetical protein